MTTASPTPPAPEQEAFIPLGSIFVDPAWNSRSNANVNTTGQKTDDADTTGLPGLITSLLTDGQDTAVVVRPVPKDGTFYTKTDKAYHLVAGFRRFRALSAIASDPAFHKDGKVPPIPHLPPGMIRAVVRHLDEKQALLLNGRENTAREALEAPDLAYNIGRLLKLGAPAVDVAASLNITQSWTSILGKIVTDLEPELFRHWREGGTIQGKEVPKSRIAVTIVHEISRMGDKKQQIAAYLEQLSTKEEEDGKNQKFVAAEKRARAMGKYLAVLNKNDVVQYMEPVVTDVLPFIIPLHETLKTKHIRGKLAAAFEEAFTAEMARDETAKPEEEPKKESKKEAKEAKNGTAPAPAKSAPATAPVGK